MLRMLSAFRP